MGLSCFGAEYDTHHAHSACRHGSGGVVSSLGAHSAGGQTSVAQRTLVAVSPAGSTSSSASQRSPEKMSHRESKEVWLPEIQVNDPPTNELNPSSPARPEIVTSSAKVRMAADGTSAKIAVVPSPTIQKRPKHLAQRAQHKDFVSSSPPLQHSLASRTDSNVFQRLPPSQSTTLRCKHIQGVYRSLLVLPLVLPGELQPLW
jgi:hypothetical protein